MAKHDEKPDDKNTKPVAEKPADPKPDDKVDAKAKPVDKQDAVHDEKPLRADAVAEAEVPGIAPEVEVNMDPGEHPDPTTPEEIDAILRNPDFDPGGKERQRLMELSRRLTSKVPANQPGHFDDAITR